MLIDTETLHGKNRLILSTESKTIAYPFYDDLLEAPIGSTCKEEKKQVEYVKVFKDQWLIKIPNNQ